MAELANEALVQHNLEARAQIDFLKRSLAKGIMEVQMKSTMKQILATFSKSESFIQDLD